MKRAAANDRTLTGLSSRRELRLFPGFRNRFSLRTGTSYITDLGNLLALDYFVGLDWRN